MNHQTELNNQTELNDQTKSWHLFLAWGFVGIPLVWGLYETFNKALQLFG